MTSRDFLTLVEAMHTLLSRAGVRGLAALATQQQVGRLCLCVAHCGAAGALSPGHHWQTSVFKRCLACRAERFCAGYEVVWHSHRIPQPSRREEWWGRWRRQSCAASGCTMQR